ncbi:hypothetical protein GGG16DRAFT_118815 [Schizophyllum commune]
MKTPSQLVERTIPAIRVETRVEPDGAGDAAMSSGIEGFDNEREGVDVRLPAAASPTPHRLQVGEALAEADATRDEPSKAIVGTVHGAEDEGHSAEEGVRSVERQIGASDGELEGEKETDVEVEPQSIGEGPPSTGEESPSTSRREPRLARGVESSPGEVRSSPGEVERIPWTDDVDLYSEPGSLLPDGVISPPGTSHHQPSDDGSGPSDGGQPGQV